MSDIAASPRAVREIEHLWIPLTDGTRLAARMWLPEDAEAEPVPAILEYIPYRKRDACRSSDRQLHRPVAQAGYACLRVDIRGSGDSEGFLTDEYTAQEQADGLEILAWIAAQPWCTGAVGMIGISWGGFNGLQLAALRPPALKAVISVGSTDDRYATDVHYYGGCLTKDNIDWSAVMFSHNALPPDPEIVGKAWRTMWLERLEANQPWAIQWMAHQRRDGYWRHGSVCEDIGAIAVPVLAINGWADNYAETVPRLLASLTGPRKGLVGPWAHDYPDTGRPGPQIGFHQECVRWWDHWLKGIENAVMDEPMYRVWMQEHVPPRGEYRERPGRWVAEAQWPSPRIAWRHLAMNPGRLDAAPGPETPLTLCSMLSTGRSQGELGRYGSGGEWPGDQREDDGASLVFLSDPLPERTEILGAPVVELTLSSDRPVAMAAVRLNDVAPSGASTRVQHGLLNLTQRNDCEAIEPLVPGERITVRIELDDIAHAFPAGHRIAVSVSSAYWPMVWPSPEIVTLTVVAGASRLELPVRPADPADDRLRPFDPPIEAEGTPVTTLREPRQNNILVTRDTARQAVTVQIVRDRGHRRYDDIGSQMGENGDAFYRIAEDDPLSAEAWTAFETHYARDGIALRILTRQRLTATRQAFRLEAELEAFENDAPVFSRRWDEQFPRDGI